MSSQWLVKCVVLGVSLSNWATEMSDNNSHCYRKYSPRQYHFDQHTHENIYQNSWFLSVTKHFSWSLAVCSLPEDTQLLTITGISQKPFVTVKSPKAMSAECTVQVFTDSIIWQGKWSRPSVHLYFISILWTDLQPWFVASVWFTVHIARQGLKVKVIGQGLASDGNMVGETLILDWGLSVF